MKVLIYLVGIVVAGALLAVPGQASVADQLDVDVLQSLPTVRLSTDLISRTPLSFPHTVTRTVRDYATSDWDGFRWRGRLVYNDFEFGYLDNNLWTAAGGYQRPMGNWGWGFFVPEEFWDPEYGESILYEGFVPYGYYNINDRLRFGGFAEFDYPFSDCDDIVQKEFSYGFGLFASYRIPLWPTVTMTPRSVITRYTTGQEDWDDSLIFSLGTDLRFSFADKWSWDAKIYYTTDTENDTIDDSFWELGTSLNYRFTDKIGLSAGFDTIEDFESFELKRFYMDARLSF